jgi:hypothetical protein
MRKNIVGRTQPGVSGEDDKWLNLEDIRSTAMEL